MTDSQPMLSIKSGASPASKATPSLLPCRVNHNGSIPLVDSHWAPTQSEDGARIAYFRGRKLHGKTVKLPDGYRGVVAEKGESEPAEKSRVPSDVVDLEQDDEAEMGSLEARAEFDEFVVWGHEATADASADPYVRGIEEWVGLAEQIHSYKEEK